MTQSATVKGTNKEKKSEFLLSMPMATRLAHDSGYLPRVQEAYGKLRNMRAGLRVQLLRDNNFIEEDDIRDHLETLANMIEDYRTITVGDASSSGTDEEDVIVGDDY